MNEQYIKAVKTINTAAAFFACRGYHTATSFGNCCHSLDVTVYFYKEELKKHIERFLRRYANENDTIEFVELTRENGDKFYTLQLSKYIS